jgi:hypothetical protein
VNTELRHFGVRVESSSCLSTRTKSVQDTLKVDDKVSKPDKSPVTSQSLLVLALNLH